MKRALLVGIDKYDAFPSLSGCVNDVWALKPLLARHDNGDLNFEVVTLSSDVDRVDRGTLLRLLQELVAPGADVALLYFAGHGSSSVNDVHLVTQDASGVEPGLLMSTVMGMVHASPIREVIVVLDCCFSGAAGGNAILGEGASAIRPGTAILTASRADQTAAETLGGQGQFSYFLCGALEGGAADTLGKVTVAGLYAYLAESFGSWGQRPVFKGSLDRLHDLRKCDSAISLGNLRRLAELFLRANTEYQLDPSYEPTDPSHDPEKGKIFSVLQRFRASRLVEPIGTEHMYYAAIESRKCKLTHLGKLYWRMASEGRL